LPPKSPCAPLPRPPEPVAPLLRPDTTQRAPTRAPRKGICGNPAPHSSFHTLPAPERRAPIPPQGHARVPPSVCDLCPQQCSRQQCQTVKNPAATQWRAPALLDLPRPERSPMLSRLPVPPGKQGPCFPGAPVAPRRCAASPHLMRRLAPQCIPPQGRLRLCLPLSAGEAQPLRCRSRLPACLFACKREEPRHYHGPRPRIAVGMLLS
jgi:hypothetical protein